MSYTITSKRLLADLFSTIAELEIKCEIARLNLGGNPFFEPFNVFTILDRERHGQLRDADIFHFCLDNGIPCNYGDASLLIAQYDENSNGKLSFTEFTQFVLPATNEALRQEAASRDYSATKAISQILPPDVCALLADLLAAELEFQKATGIIKHELNSRVDFTTKHAFGWMDITKPLGGIDRHDVRQFVDDHIRYLSEEELDAVIRRCDTDGDESISYLEFLEVVQGIEPSVPETTQTIHHQSYRGASPLRGTHVTRTYHSPSRIGANPIVTTIERSPGRVTTTTRSPARVTSVSRSPGRVETHHYSPTRTHIHHSPSRSYINHSPSRTCIRHSPSRTHINHSPYREVRTRIRESPRATAEVRRSPTRHSPIRYNLGRDSPVKKTTTVINNDNERQIRTEHYSRGPARVETRYNYSSSKVSPPKVTRVSSSPERVTRVTSSPGRVQVETTNRYSPSRVYTTETRHYSPSRVSIHETRHYSPTSRYIEERKYYSPSRVHVQDTIRHSPSRVHVTRDYHSPTRSSSPLKGFEEEELVQSFIQLIKVEARLESAKEALAQRPYFTVHDAFKIFDCSGYGKVEPLDVKDAYGKYGITITLDEARLIVSRYDQNKDQLLRFKEFSEIFFPTDRISADALHERNIRFPTGYYLAPEIIDPVTREDFVRVLNLALEAENLAEHIRQKHSKRPLFNRSDAFDAINRFGTLTITEHDFQDLLARHRFFATGKELVSLMDRFDKSKKGSVLFSEFIDEITPHSPVKY
ncbi:unnamed protein product [Moneuplotes crassus]|uniref:EF-hand domain-containing protein n=1 Tax=Euplotes crassus TaxID=5936 RepID=A0AAD1Y9P7_EUPCR|nr:unnamed protein product [Moneuplotes crassus]